MAQLWAVLATIETYATEDKDALPGSHKDGEGIYNYLTTNLGVRSSNIIRLKDSDASRTGIITAFTRHLIDNTEINHGDALLFCFSGHGSSQEAPAGWAATKNEEGIDVVEAIVPWDEGLKDPKSGVQTCTIPDRTLAVLLEKAASTHGRNITVILDCCHSGHGTRGQYHLPGDGDVQLVARSANPLLLVPLRPDLDLDLVGSTGSTSASRSGVTKRGNGRFTSLVGDHVLLAACGQFERAMGGPFGGGIFTYFLVQALRRTDIHPRTYARLLEVVDHGIDQLRRIPNSVITQHPQCDGIMRDRRLFDQDILEPGVIQVEPINGDPDSDFIVFAGQIHGIDAGTTITVYQQAIGSPSKTCIGVATTMKAYSIKSYARLNGDNPTVRGLSNITKSRYTAVVTDKPDHLRYILVNLAPHNPRSRISVESFRQSLRNATLGTEAPTTICEANEPEEADLKLLFDAEGGMSLYHLDPVLGGLGTNPSRITAEEVQHANFASILHGIARFKNLLAMENTARPFANDISFEVLHLKRIGGPASYVDEDGFFLRSFSSVEFDSNDEVVIEQGTDDEQDDYAINLRNHSSQDLYVQVWYFDPSTYSISPCYQSASDKPTLLMNGGNLRIGASAERAEPLNFYVSEGSTRETLFAKVFLTNEYTKLDFLHQKELIGEDENGSSVIISLSSSNTRASTRSSTKSTVTVVSVPVTHLEGGWDTVTRKITVVESL